MFLFAPLIIPSFLCVGILPVKYSDLYLIQCRFLKRIDQELGLGYKIHKKELHQSVGVLYAEVRHQYLNFVSIDVLLIHLVWA